MTYYGEKKHFGDPKPVKIDKPKKKYIFKKKPTGEANIFREIWAERGPYSQIDGSYLGEYNVCFFSHILPKGQNKYPAFKLNKQNIVLKTLSQHHAWEHNKESLRGLPEWEWVFQLETSLKEQYALLIK